jgi:hypothetical protein
MLSGVCVSPCLVLSFPFCHLQLGHYGGMVDEIDSLKRDKNVLMLELVRLRQQQQVRTSVCGLNGQ